MADEGSYDVKIDHDKGRGQGLDPDLGLDLDNDPANTFDNDNPDVIGPNNDTYNVAGAIIELVTKPIDENISAPDLKAKIEQLVEFTRRLQLKPRTQLDRHAADADASYYIGINYGAVSQKKVGTFQATLGLQLEKANTTLEELAGRVQSSRVDLSSVWSKAARIARIWVEARVIVGPTTPELDELTGLVTLVCSYLVARSEFTGIGWGKNHFAGLFYKSKLSDVRNSLMSVTVKTLLYNNAPVWARDLVTQCTTKSTLLGVDIVNDPATTSQEWVAQVFQGTDDLVYEANKNPYVTNPLGPEPVGPTGLERTGAVIEFRSALGALITQGGAQPLDKWVDIAEGVRQLVVLGNT